MALTLENGPEMSTAQDIERRLTKTLNTVWCSKILLLIAVSGFMCDMLTKAFILLLAQLQFGPRNVQFGNFGASHRSLLPIQDN